MGYVNLLVISCTMMPICLCYWILWWSLYNHHSAPKTHSDIWFCQLWLRLILWIWFVTYKAKVDGISALRVRGSGSSFDFSWPTLLTQWLKHMTPWIVWFPGMILSFSIVLLQSVMVVLVLVSADIGGWIMSFTFSFLFFSFL